MRVHIARTTEPASLANLAAALPANVVLTASENVPPETEVLVVGFASPEMLAPLHRLKTVIVPFAGLVPVSRDALLTRPDVTTYNLHFNAAATAEKALELLFAAAKGTVRADSGMRSNSWAPRFDASNAIELCGKRAVIVGYGEIGRRVAQALEAMGVSVKGIRRNPTVGPVPVLPPSELPQVAIEADLLIVCAPLTPETEGLVSAEVIKALPQGAIVVNVGRGAVIDEEALYTALETGKLHGAGLDVWWQYPQTEEPCPPSRFNFAGLPNVVMSPHTGGVVIDTEPKRMAALADLLRRLATGQDLPKPTNVSAGY